jgi:hypothetical protein
VEDFLERFVVATKENEQIEIFEDILSVSTGGFKGVLTQVS